MNSNCALDHKMSSSENLERCIIIRLAFEANSIAKSRSLTASIEFKLIRSNPKSSAVRSRLIG